MPVHLLIACSCISFHVENVARVNPTVEVEETEEVYQGQPQESEVAEEDQEFGTDCANFYNTQGKPRFILNLVSYI